jgi:hypothetical protein
MIRALCFGLALMACACAAVSGDVADLAVEFRALRMQSGHFSGGTWNDAVDRFGGRKHEVMLRLGELLGDGKRMQAEVVALLGAPDEVLKPGDMKYAHAYSGGDARVRELLVYQWRGGHDFLYFTSDGAHVLASGWWHAYE